MINGGVAGVTDLGTLITGMEAHLYAADTPTDHGFIAWSMQPLMAASSTVLATAGTMYIARVRRVPLGASVTNIVAFVTVGGSSLTSGQCFAALYTAGGVLVAATADQASAWASATVKTMALAGGPYTAAGGDYYVGLWFNGTTGPTLRTSANTSAATVNIGLSTPNLMTATANTGLTTSAPATLGAQTGSSIHMLVALS